MAGHGAWLAVLFTSPSIFIDIVMIRFGETNLQISSIIDSYLPTTHVYFCFQTITSVNIKGFSPNLVCAFILWRSGLGLLLTRFCQFLTELSACHNIVAGYYCFTFLFIVFCGFFLQKFQNLFTDFKALFP